MGIAFLLMGCGVKGDPIPYVEIGVTETKVEQDPIDLNASQEKVDKKDKPTRSKRKK